MVANNLRVKLRIYQVGLNQTRFSIQTHHGVRFNVPFKTPPEKEWSEVTVDCSKAESSGVDLKNLAIQHIELIGFPKQANNGAYYLVSKFEILTGSP